jgi:hypothetical protein
VKSFTEALSRFCRLWDHDSHSVEESTPRKLKYLDVDFSSTKHKYSEKCVQIDIIDHRIAVKNKELIVSEYGCRGRIGNKIGDIIYIWRAISISG